MLRYDPHFVDPEGMNPSLSNFTDLFDEKLDAFSVRNAPIDLGSCGEEDSNTSGIDIYKSSFF